MTLRPDRAHRLRTLLASALDLVPAEQVVQEQLDAAPVPNVLIQAAYTRGRSDGYMEGLRDGVGAMREVARGAC